MAMFRSEVIRYKDQHMEYTKEVTETSAKHNYKVPRILWENLESVLLAQSKKYIEELAKILEVPAKELQRRVMPSADSIKVILQDVEEGVCQAYVQEGVCTVFCRKPIYHGTFCAKHSAHRPIVKDVKARTIQRVKDIETLPPLWLLDNQLITSDGQKVGTINHDTQKIKIYVIDK